jgi:2-polyprenyl-3-methyl-5-hydroxy-6-metoxy-1,4-benzoquinol methylase
LNSSFLVKVFGFRGTLMHGDTLVLNRWRWLKKRLPVTANGETLLDVGCGTGAFTIGTARRGYHATGISWDERNQRVAAERAQICGVSSSDFVIGDVRRLDSIDALAPAYDVVICLECVEHILDDRKLFRDMAARLKPGGRLLLTTPNYFYLPISKYELGPWQKTEEAWHVRRGYSPDMLRELCHTAGLTCSEVSYCSGIVSQKVTWFWRATRSLPGGAGVHWLLTFPFRLLAAIVPDEWITRAMGLPLYSIGLEASKPRFE